MSRAPHRPRPDRGIREYAAERTAGLLRRAAFQANRTARLRTVESIHDLRVAIRRLSQGLRLFAPFFPADSARRLRRKLDGVMGLASAVRDLDVAADLLKRGRTAPPSALAARLCAERQVEEGKLLPALKRWGRRDFEKKWRRRLGV